MYVHIGHVTDHAGPRRRSECPPGTKLWRLPAFVTQFWHPRSGHICKTNNNKKSSERERHETIQELEPLPATFFCWVGSGRVPWPKLGYKGWRAPQLSARGTLATSGAGLVCHVYLKKHYIF